MKRAFVCLVLMLMAGCTLSMTSEPHPIPETSTTVTATEAAPADREPDAMKDVTIKSVKYSRGVATVTFRVKNHSTETSNYNVYFVAENKSGSTQYDAASAYVAHIRPKQKRVDEVLLNPVPKKAKVSVVNVDRWPS